MASKLAVLWTLYTIIYFFSCVHAVTTHNQYPLEFITQNTASANAMTYGFRLLEDIRQVRMGCEERRDNLEQRFAVELQNWMIYSQQTQQVTSKADFEDSYASETRRTVENTITSTYREIYSSRARRLNVIERQCDDALEKLLQQRKMSMLGLVADLMRRDMERLKELVGELVSYRTQLQNGLQHCVEHQTISYESKLSSKLLSPEDFCSGPDIEILTSFLKHMLIIITEEQIQFFGDDEDLGVDTPCGISGCEEVKDSTEEFHAHTVPPSQENIQLPTRPSHPPSSPSSHRLPTRPTQPHVPPHTISEQTPDTTSQPHSVSTAPPTNTKPTEGKTETVPIAPDTSSGPTRPEEITPDTKPSVTEPVTTTKQNDTTPDMTGPRIESEMPTSTPEHYKEQTTTQLESHTTAAPTQDLLSPTAPEWLNDAVDEILRPKEQAQDQAKTGSPVPYDTEGELRSHHHGDDRGHHSSEDSRDDSESRHSTGSRHNEDSKPHDTVIDIPPAETDGQKMEDGSNSSHNIYRPLIYSFATVGCVLLAATLVLVVAILVVQYKRRQLLSAQILTQEQKIAIMKQTGYVNPTYKFFDKQNDG